MKYVFVTTDANGSTKRYIYNHFKTAFRHFLETKHLPKVVRRVM